MLDIGSLVHHLAEGPKRTKIEDIQVRGLLLVNRINAVFNMNGRRALQFLGTDDQVYQALIHNEADDATDYLVVHPSGVSGHTFEAVRVEGEWVTTYISDESYPGMMGGVGGVLLDAANNTYRDFVMKNEGVVPETLTEDDVNLDTFAKEVSSRKITMSHAGNMRLAGISF